MQWRRDIITVLGHGKVVDDDGDFEVHCLFGSGGLNKDSFSPNHLFPLLKYTILHSRGILLLQIVDLAEPLSCPFIVRLLH